MISASVAARNTSILSRFSMNTASSTQLYAATLPIYGFGHHIAEVVSGGAWCEKPRFSVSAAVIASEVVLAFALCAVVHVRLPKNFSSTLFACDLTSFESSTPG